MHCSSPISSLENQEEILPTAIVEHIKKYYQQRDGKGLVIQESKSDSTLELHFKEAEAFTLMKIYIPTSQASAQRGSFIQTDLNKDALKDYVIMTRTEGAWGGGNVSGTEYFVFLQNMSGYEFQHHTHGYLLNNCETGGFILEKLDQGELIGFSYCYGPNDGHCCPSLEYKTTIHYNNGKLTHLKSERVN
jgi:hypothetical protein